MFIALKPLDEREVSADQVIARLRAELATVPGATALPAGGAGPPRRRPRRATRSTSTRSRATTSTSSRTWAPRVARGACARCPQLTDVNSDQQDRGLQIVARDRPRHRVAARHHARSDRRHALRRLRPAAGVDDLHAAEPVPRGHGGRRRDFWQRPETLSDIYVPLAERRAGAAVSAFSALRADRDAAGGQPPGPVPRRHAVVQSRAGRRRSATRSTAIEAAIARSACRPRIHGSFQGTAQAFQASLANQPLLILAALLAVYIVLGMLYESYIHPITILSTLPSAGVGALLALLAVRHRAERHRAHRHHPADRHREEERDHDDRLRARGGARRRARRPREAIYEACLLRFRPIMMTTMAALLGRAAAGARHRRRRGAAPAARHRHRRRAASSARCYALHDAGGVPLSRPRAAAVGAARTAGRHLATAAAPRDPSREAPDCRRASRGRLLLAGALLLLASGCTVGPDYVRPE